MSERLHVGLNLLHANPGVGGAYNYVQAVIGALAEHAPEIRLTGFVSPDTVGVLEGIEGIEPVMIPIDSLDRRKRIGFELARIDRLAESRGVQVLHWFANTCSLGRRMPSVVTFHDMLVFHNPVDYPRSQRLYLHTLIPRSARRCTLRLPVSQATSDDMDRLFGARPEATQVVYYPLPDELFGPAAPPRLDLPARYWLYVGHFYPHKNHERLIRAYAQVPESLRLPLLLRGDDKSEGPKCDALIESFGLTGQVVRLPRLSQEEMIELLRRAEALIYPSLGEGAGQPVMEAMAAGVPVLASDIPTNREFLSESPLPRFDPTSIDSIAHHLTELAQGRYDLEAGTACGRIRAAQMRRPVVARQLAKCYRAAVECRPLASRPK